MDILQLVSHLKSRASLKYLSQSNREAIYNPWFLSFVGLILVFLTVNIVFIVYAIRSNPGLVSSDYYEQGREYENNFVQMKEARNNLHWETKLQLPEKIYLNIPGTYRFSAVDSSGSSIMDADVRLIVYRPSDANADFEQSVEQVAPGYYQTRLTFPLPGIWDINLNVAEGKNIYRYTQRVNVLTQ